MRYRLQKKLLMREDQDQTTFQIAVNILAISRRRPRCESRGEETKSHHSCSRSNFVDLPLSHQLSINARCLCRVYK